MTKINSIKTSNGSVHKIDEGIGFPSDKYIELELGASGSRYVAPANGWFYITGMDGLTKSDYGFVLRRYSDKFGVESRIGSQPMITGWCTGNLKVRKGDEVGVYHNMEASDTRFRFIYAQGSEPEE